MKPQLKNLEDQTIVITGASSGIGLATARMAAAEGARVVLAARSGDGLWDAAHALRERGGEVACVIADVTRERDVRQIAQAAVRRFGGIDTWVNNAGVSVYGPMEDVPLDDQRQVFETTYWGVVHGSLVALDYLRAGGGGALINIGSVLSERAFPLQGPYSAAKHAVRGFTDALRMELMHDREPISVTLIKPSAIDTPYLQHAQNYMAMEPRNPPPYYAPDLVAEAILYAAERPVREITVGGAGRLIEAFDHWMPGITDSVMARLVPWWEQSSEPAAPRGGAGLHEPAGRAEERSGQAGFVRERSAYTWLAMHPMATLGVAAAAGAALAVAGSALRRRA